MVKKKTQRTKDDTAAKEEPIIMKEILAYKYSAKGTSSLFEAIILKGEPCFVTFNLVTKEPRIVPNNIEDVFGLVWNEIISGGIKGKLNPYNDTEYQTHEHGPLYMSTLSKFIGDNFSADIIHKRDGSILSFNREKFYSYDDIYNHQSKGPDVEIKIEVKWVEKEKEDCDGCEGVRGLEGAFHTLDDESESTIASPNAVTPSHPSPVVFIKCPQCKFENIHQELIDHHVKYGHKNDPA